MSRPVAKVVKAPPRVGAAADSGSPAVTKLSPFDQMRLTTASMRALYWKGGRLEPAALEHALQLMLTDLPLLAGRLTPLRGKMADVHILHTNDGVPLVVADDPRSMEAVAPSSWPTRGFKVASPKLASYMEQMDTGRRMANGQEPLMKVRLTRLADGDILAVTLSHTITDGMRWPALLAHLASRYRQAARELNGLAVEVAADGLLVPSDRTAFSSAKLLETLPKGVKIAELPPVALNLGPSLWDYLRAVGLLLRDAVRRVDLAVLHVSKPRMEQLKAGALAMQATAAGGELGRGTTITTGDVAQALGGLMIHAANGQPLVPRGAKHQAVLVQMPPAGKLTLGNATHILAVAAQPEQQLPAGDDYMASLFVLAGLIRTATAEFRSQPEKWVEAVSHLEGMAQANPLKLLAYLAGRLLPHLSSSTNYIGNCPGHAKLDFGVPGLPTCQQWMVSPMATEMVMIRPAPDGLFFLITLPPRQQQVLHAHPLLAALVPDAAWLGDGPELTDVMVH